MRAELDFGRAGNIGPVVPPTHGKTRITIGIDNEFLVWFRDRGPQSGGASYHYGQ